jgi:hypothetical protein
MALRKASTIPTSFTDNTPVPLFFLHRTQKLFKRDAIGKSGAVNGQGPFHKPGYSPSNAAVWDNIRILDVLLLLQAFLHQAAFGTSQAHLPACGCQR